MVCDRSRLTFVKMYMLALALIFLGGCVTSYDSGNASVDKQKALEANIKLGMAYLQKKQRDHAVRSFSKALEYDPKSAEANHGMALVHQLNGEYDQAEKRYAKALKGRAAFSKSAIEFSYGRFLMEQGNCTGAAPYFDRVSKDFSYSNRANALFNIGRCAAKEGNENKAVKSYEHALNLDARFSPASLEMADIMFRRGDYATSKRYMDQFAKSARHSARSLWLGIRLERIFGNKDKEASYVLALKNLHPYSQEYLNYKKMFESGSAQ